MTTALPTQWPEDRVTALPPGCNIATWPEQSTPKPSDRLELFYVGGITPPLYDLKPMVDAVRDLDDIVLTLCCHASEWKKFQSYYGSIDEDKIKIVHTYGEGLKPYYARADIFGLFWRAHPYLAITMPVKVMEALGHGLPLVTTAGTVGARFVAQEEIGWVVSTADEFRELFINLQANPHIIAEKRERAKTVRKYHTWPARAQLVADTLC